MKVLQKNTMENIKMGLCFECGFAFVFESKSKNKSKNNNKHNLLLFILR